LEQKSENELVSASTVHAKDLLDDSLKLIQLEIKRIAEQYDPTDGFSSTQITTLTGLMRTLSSVDKNSEKEDEEVSRLMNLPLDQLEKELGEMFQKLKEPK